MIEYDWSVSIDGQDVRPILREGGTIDYGRPTASSPWQAPRAVFELETIETYPQYEADGGTWPTIVKGDPVIIHVTWDGVTQWRRFTGVVQAIDYGRTGTRVTAVGASADLDAKVCGDATVIPWSISGIPFEADYDRIARYADELGLTITVEGTYGRWVTAIPAGTQPSNAIDRIVSMADDCSALFYESRVGSLFYRLRDHTRPARYTVPAAIVDRDSVDLVTERGFLRNAIDVYFGPPDPVTGEQSRVFEQDAASVSLVGERRGDPLITQLQNTPGARGRATSYISQFADRVEMPDVTVCMSLITDTDDADDLLAVGERDPLRITPLPAWAPVTNYDGDVIGITDIMARNDYLIILHMDAGPVAGDEDDGNWVTDGDITGGDDTGIVEIDGRLHRWHLFESDGSLTVNTDVVCDLVVIAGGGPAGVTFSYEGGGGGAGGVYDRPFALAADDSPYPVVVGAGGTVAHTNGEDSSFGDVVAYGGGYGANRNAGIPGGDGGSGGGGGTDPATAGGTALGGSIDGGTTDTPSLFYGHDGETGTYHLSSGTGGGAGNAGASGGDGRSITIMGTTVTYAYGGRDYGVAGYTTPGSGGTSIFNATAPGYAGVVIVQYPIEPGGGTQYGAAYDTETTYETDTLTYEGKAP